MSNVFYFIIHTNGATIEEIGVFFWGGRAKTKTFSDESLFLA